MRHPRTNGYILIQALVAVAGLLALMAILVHDNQATIDNTQSDLREARAHMAADGAVQQGLTVLSTANENLVTLTDTWAQLGSTGTEEFDQSDGSSFRMQILDAGSMINLNTATQQQLQLLPLDQDQVDCLLDWVQTGENPRTDGAKDSYYNGLTQPYNAKLGPLSTVNELLLIRNWTGQTLYQSPTDTTTLTLPSDQNGNVLPLASIFTVDSGAPNTSTAGASLINLDARNGTATNSLTRLGVPGQIAATITSAPRANFKALFAVRGVTSLSPNVLSNLLNGVTFTTAARTTGKINLNTASQAVLQSIPNVSTATAATIINQQTTGFTSLGALETTAALPAAELGQIADSFTVGSDTWIVRAYGESNGVGYAEEAVVGYRNSVLQIVSTNHLHTAGIPSWWNWNSTITETQQAGVTQ